MELTFKLKFQGQEPDAHRLPLYDGVQSIFGFAKCLTIVTNAFITREVIHSAATNRGAKFYLLPSRPGSFLETIQIVFENNIVQGIGLGVLGNIATDFIKFSFKRAIGESPEAESRYVTRLATDDEPFFDDLTSAIEGPLNEAHRVINSRRDTVTLVKGRTDLVIFDFDSKEWVKSVKLDDQEEVVTGNVTRYNVISGRGRLYDIQLRCTLPFEPSESLDAASRLNLSWSLDQANNFGFATLNFTVQRISSANGITKRYVVLSCRRGS